ncbi:MAG: hypothetical protein ABWZ18_03210 [Solirubrobacterales bacterium]
MPVEWSDEVDEILGNDLAAGFAYTTPAKGVVITPMAPLAVRDRERGTVTLSSSLGLPKKLIRIRANPEVAIAYHAREHSALDREQYVLVQGRASFDPKPDREWLESITPEWERFLGPRRTGVVGGWLDVYHWQRVPIVVEVERVLSWPTAGCAGEPEVFGAPRPSSAPDSQSAPKKGTAARESTTRLRRQAGRLPHTLLGWVGADGLPEVVPVSVTAADDQAVELASAATIIPPGQRRAGLTAHAFKPRMIGQEQRVHTGWLERDGARIRYSPHTRAGYALPASKALFVAGAAGGTRAGMRRARAAGLA